VLRQKQGDSSGGKRRLETCMYAIIRSGARQYRAEVGRTIDVERLPNPVDESFEISDVLLVGDGDNTVIGQPLVEGARVKVTVVDQFRGDKVIVFKYRQRTNFRRKRGHRQYYTRLRVDDIMV
jgi:large subunit ribosomal protein L21